jgi:hypothetical protein
MGRPTPAHRLPATTSTHPEARRCRPTCQPDSAPRRTLTPPMPPRASNRLRTTLRSVAAILCTPPAHHRTSLLWSLSSDFVPSQPHQLPANTIQSPYIHRANGLLQIAVSTLLRTSSIGPREGLFAEHCRYGTRDLSIPEKTKDCSRHANFPVVAIGGDGCQETSDVRIRDGPIVDYFDFEPSSMGSVSIA